MTITQTTDVVARLVSSVEGRAVPIRATRSLADDPGPAFGIATIKMVSEEVVQAIAFGLIDEEPEVVTRWNPLSRDTASLELFAEALDSYLRDRVANDTMPRIWLPHGNALSVLEVLGYRYRTNREASDTLRTLGRHCLTLAQEARYEGQQAVVVGAEVLRSHVATGQSPVEDGHLGALLAWVDPPADRPAREEAAARALLPASGILPRGADDRVEALRRIAKGRGAEADAARSEIETILREGALAEWQLLLDARAAILALPMPATPGIDVLVKASVDRLEYKILNDVSPPRRPVALSRMVEEHEFSADQAEDVAVRGDRMARDEARAKGKVVSGTVTSVTWGGRSGCKPCTVVLRTDQPVLRVRRGTTLRTLAGDVVFRVEAEGEDAGVRVLTLSVNNGVRTVNRWSLPIDVELTDSYPRDFSFVRNKARRAMQAANTPLVFADELPAVAPAAPAPDDLLARATGLRRP